MHIIVEEAIPAIVSFVGGTIFGFIVGLLVERLGKKEDETKRKRALEEIVAFIIVIVWTLSALLSTLDTNRHTPIELHILMGGVFGILLNGGENPILSSILKRVTISKNDTKSDNDGDNK